jgi:flagellar basal body-associated protein FliL
MEKNNSSIMIVVGAVVIALVLGIGFATHWFSMGVAEHSDMNQKTTMPYVK